jgi:hypothetical protein
VTAPAFFGCFTHRWTAEILRQRPMILPNRHYIYPGAVEEVEKGALEVLIQPGEELPSQQPFLATCALGFRDPATPTGIWSTPHPDWLCAVSGGYAYLVDVADPHRFTMLRYRPVLEIVCYLPDDPDASLKVSQNLPGGLLLFVGHHSILAWGRDGEAWESEKLSWEGITGVVIEGNILRGMGWDLRTDKDLPFTLDLATGARI